MTEVIKGAIEDHLGRIIYPDTEADQVMTQNGKTVEERLAEMLANFAKYLPLTGGTIAGDVKTSRGNYFVSNWGCFSACIDGTVMIADNAYLNPTNNTYHYAVNHATMGARGIVFRGRIGGVWYFDTGSIATTANATFVPNFVSITDRSTKLHTGDLNNITENTLVNGSSMANAPTADWYFVQHIAHSGDTTYATQIAYSFFGPDVYRRRKSQGGWSTWDPFLTPSNTPTQHYSTSAPTASDGKDGDVWDVYV